MSNRDNLWSHYYPEGIVNEASPNQFLFQSFKYVADVQFKLLMVIDKTLKLPIIYTVDFFHIQYFITREKTTRHP